MSTTRTQLEWMRTIGVGDVIARLNGPWRVVRQVSRYQDGDLRTVALSIKRCSWTHRCYTIYGYNDLRMLGYRKIAVKRRALRKAIDRQIAASIHQPAWERRILKCCDVEGVA